MKNKTPMLKQYLDIKKRYPECILFYRMGDFYEMFFEDAVVASKILQITLTSRDKNKDEPIPMCGVPFHAAEGYIAKLVEAGKRVAICEQVEDPKKAKGIVKREVVRVVTPGLLTIDGGLSSKTNNFVATICGDFEKGPIGVASLDITTGEFKVTRARSLDSGLGELFRIQPRELLLAESLKEDQVVTRIRQALPDVFISWQPDVVFQPDRAEQVLKDHFGVLTIEGFGLSSGDVSIGAAGALLSYCLETHHGSIGHVKTLSPYRLDSYLRVDEATVRNLELVANSLDGGVKGSLLHVIDKTATPMGGRLLKKWLLYPLVDKGEIERRLDAVETLLELHDKRGKLRGLLKKIYDMERLIGKVVMETAGPRDLLALRDSLGKMPEIREVLSSILPAQREKKHGLLGSLFGEIDPLEDVFSIIDGSIKDDAPAHLRDGNIIKEGFNEELDELIEIQRNGRGYIAQIEARERERTSIPNLKVGYNRVFGYYIEVSKSHVSKVPEDYIRKQTLASAERYITPELKEIEEKILTAQEKRLELEAEIFKKVRSEVGANGSRVQKSARALARLDCLCSLAQVAESNNYSRPVMSEEDEIDIVQGRHPVVEQTLQEKTFVPNDMRLNHKDSLLVLITGPNMAGKSTVLRQTALICLMAQMGSFVPAESARLSVLDQIFTRVGATDYLSRGQSTFMVEMKETANILNNATSKSLVILDEIGRGTSTYDGLSIAWAVAEHLLFKDKKGVKTLFATHYHELTALGRQYKKVRNLHVQVKEHEGRIYFLHTLKEGATSKSYGIQVAALAGVPAQVIEAAERILRDIENKNRKNRVPVATVDSSDYKIVVQKTLPIKEDKEGEIVKRLRKIDINQTTPLEALNILDELCKLIKKRN
ncbi:MAG: DNA mismatch repair protein MutS [Thermodesulfobacteria bacterium]|nr:DNA mismatch repair protein MutS [Thermodesulfobacteriota bacterium]